jgi:uncharacterized protein YjiS (DUF1127 family)
MTTHNQTSSFLSLGKFGGMLFNRQTPVRNAETHPGILSSLFGGFNTWRERRAAVNELAGLSDRELADIGLTREQIPDVVYRKRDKAI